MSTFRRVVLPGAVSIAAALAGCESSEPVAAGFRDLPADVVLSQVTHYLTVDGVRNARLLSDSVYQHADSSSVQLFGVNLTLYDEDGRVRATVTSLTGRLDESTNRMVATGDVVLITPDDNRLETEELHYDPPSHRVWSDVATRRIGPDGSVAEGDGFTTDDELRNIQIVNARGSAGRIRF